MSKFRPRFFSLTFILAFITLSPFHFNVCEYAASVPQEIQQTASEHSADCIHTDANFSKYIKKEAGRPTIDENVIETEAGAIYKQLKAKLESTENPDVSIRKIVIDPGHGGRDPGCSGHGSQEKHLALNIALMVGQTISAYHPDIEVIYTRDSDVFVSLNRRAEIANKSKADLFISIHCNNILNASHIDGSETYVLGLHRAEDNLAVAKRENAAIFYEDDYQQNYDGYDPNSTEGHIILSMFQNAYLEQSILLAEKIERNIKFDASRRSRGVKQAGFLVLRKTTMPSVLVEAGYLSNSSDNAYLKTQYGQQQIAAAIFNAFSEYKHEIEETTGSYSTQRVLAHRATYQVPVAKPMAPITPKILKSPSRPIASKNEQLTPKGIEKPSLIIPSLKKEIPQTKPRIENTENRTAVKFKVLLTVTKELADIDKSPWNNINYSVQVVREGKNFKYLAIGFNSFDEAVTAKQELRESGFDEAFVVAYQNGKRIKMESAKAQLGLD